MEQFGTLHMIQALFLKFWPLVNPRPVQGFAGAITPQSILDMRLKCKD